MQKMVIDAPAKINLHLRVKALRPDGFHDLESIFTALAFGDSLHFEPISGERALEINMEGPFGALLDALPVEKNIVYRAVSLFRRKTGYKQGLRVRIEKRIPLGSGLGGGSSDAASALLALNSLSGAPLAPDSLAELAVSLGSDVAFFLNETGAAWVSGRGEYIQPLAAPKNLAVVLVNPGFPSETAAAFRLLDEFRASAGKNEPEQGPPRDVLTGALAAHPRTWPFENDFLPVFLHNSSQNPRTTDVSGAYTEMLRQLRDMGADFAGLSGSGSACFGIFAEKEKAVDAEKTLKKNWPFVNLTFLLARRALTVVE